MTSVWDFDFTGAVQTFSAPAKGIYKLEVWGAQGGILNTTYPGGYGGYSVGQVQLDKETTLYVYVGGQGKAYSGSVPVAGGFNGGGSVTKTDKSSAGGGGATHIALVSGLLSTLSNNQSNLLIVAGAGGGAIEPWGGGTGTADQVSGGHGGGYATPDKIAYTSRISGGNVTTYGASQSASTGSTYSWSDRSNKLGTFGQGGDTMGETANSCGGGGGYYGGGGSFGIGGGCGGSGYIGNPLLTEKYMATWNDLTSDDENTKTLHISIALNTAVANCAKTGNGYARITLVKDLSSSENFLDGFYTRTRKTNWTWATQ